MEDALPEQARNERGIKCAFSVRTEYFSISFFRFLGDLSFHYSGSWQFSVTPPEWVFGADVGLTMLPGYTTVTGADLSVVLIS